MTDEEIKSLIVQVATQAASKGPGWPQEGVVLRQVRDRIFGERGLADLPTQQAILNSWHDLFAERRLAWGYDLDYPGAPFFHIRVR